MIDSKMDNPEYERILQENVTLKSDTLIFREDIKHLTEVNKRLESELEISRKKILDLVNALYKYRRDHIKTNCVKRVLKSINSLKRLQD